jgi:predicted dehydrogenase
MQQLPAYKIYGTKGCFIKQRADIQEDDLLAGKKPNTPNWGVEAKEKWGVLSTDTEGKISTETIPSLAGNYGTFYEKMANAINHNEAVPTSAKHGAAIIRILEAARASFTEGKVIVL